MRWLQEKVKESFTLYGHLIQSWSRSSGCQSKDDVVIYPSVWCQYIVQHYCFLSLTCIYTAWWQRHVCEELAWSCCIYWCDQGLQMQPVKANNNCYHYSYYWYYYYSHLLYVCRVMKLKLRLMMMTRMLVICVVVAKQHQRMAVRRTRLKVMGRVLKVRTKTSLRHQGIKMFQSTSVKFAADSVRDCTHPLYVFCCCCWWCCFRVC